MATKVTFTLDEQTVHRINDAATRLRKAKSEVVRAAVADYYERIGRLSEIERRRMLQIIDDVVSHLPRRRSADVARELDRVHDARRSGGRGGRRA